jgi:hypothetical protein
MRTGIVLLAVAMGAGLESSAAAEIHTLLGGSRWRTSFADDAYYRQGDEHSVTGPTSRYTQSVNDGSTGSVYEPACGCHPDDCCAPECGCCDDACCNDGCCDSCCGNDCGCGCGAAAAAGLFTGCGCLSCVEGFTLAGVMGLDDPFVIGGWAEGVWMDNNVPLSQAYNDLLSFDDVPDHFHGGQEWVYAGIAANGENGPALGFRVDAVYGTDAQKTQSFGNPGAGVRNQGTFDASWDNGEYGWAMPQCYGELAVGDLGVKVGHFFTPLGYEVIPVTGNFFRSHSYTMYNSEPFTHTGALATYGFSDALTLYGGWALGWDTGFDQLNSGNIAIGGFAVNMGDNVTFTYLSTYGNFGWRDGGDDNSYSHSCVLVVSLTDNLQYIAQSDMIDTSNPGVSEYDTIGINQYLIYNLNDIVGLGGRVEWWKADGVSFYQATSGLNIRLLSNVVIRPEWRQDWAPGIGLDEDTILCDAIVTF